MKNLFIQVHIMDNHLYLKRSHAISLGILIICLFILVIQAGCQGCYGLGITDIDGYICDEVGKPIEGANVILRGKQLEIGAIDYKCESDVEGKFGFSIGHQPGMVIHDVKMNVTKDGYEDYTKTMKILDPHPRIVMKNKANNNQK